MQFLGTQTRITITKLALTILICLWPVVALDTKLVAARDLSGGELIKNCYRTSPHESRANVARYEMCLSFLGAVQGTLLSLSEMGDSVRVACVHGGIPLEQLRRTVVTYWRRNPSSQHLLATTLALRAFADAWPCRGTPGRQPR